LKCLSRVRGAKHPHHDLKTTIGPCSCSLIRAEQNWYRLWPTVWPQLPNSQEPLQGEMSRYPEAGVKRSKLF
jgi:hypothetical protein